MGIAKEQLQPVNTPLIGFEGETVRAEGLIKLPITFGTEPQHKTTMANFLVVKIPSSYNAITIAQ